MAHPEKESLIAEGHLDGVIINEARGTNGFAYDKHFEVNGKTVAEMSLEEKNIFSHRKKATQQLIEFLSQNGNNIS